MKTILRVVSGVALAAIIAGTVAVAGQFQPTDATDAFWASNSAVKAAVRADWCDPVDMLRDNGMAGRESLSASDQIAYEIVRAALLDKFAETNGSDMQVELVHGAFCQATR